MLINNNHGHLFIALCGYPQVGKSEVQMILHDEYNAEGVDDGAILRESAKILYDLKDEDVLTTKGKAKALPYMDIDGNPVTVRDVLGKMGQHVESLFGPSFLPLRAIERATKHIGDNKRIFVFGSVRRNQGLVYKQAGGVVIEIKRPGFDMAGRAFDDYNRDCIDYTIDNDGDLDALEDKVVAVMNNILEKRGVNLDA